MPHCQEDAIKMMKDSFVGAYNKSEWTLAAIRLFEQHHSSDILYQISERLGRSADEKRRKEHMND